VLAHSHSPDERALLGTAHARRLRSRATSGIVQAEPPDVACGRAVRPRSSGLRAETSGIVQAESPDVACGRAVRGGAHPGYERTDAPIALLRPLLSGRVSNPPSFGIHAVSVDPEIALPTFSLRPITAILLQRRCGRGRVRNPPLQAPGDGGVTPRPRSRAPARPRAEASVPAPAARSGCRCPGWRSRIAG
jgi:hypothetical protein